MEIVNCTEVAPVGTVTVAGTKAPDPRISRLITEPPAGAGPVKVTVPVTVPPPTTTYLDR